MRSGTFTRICVVDATVDSARTTRDSVGLPESLLTPAENHTAGNPSDGENPEPIRVMFSPAVTHEELEDVHSHPCNFPVTVDARTVVEVVDVEGVVVTVVVEDVVETAAEAPPEVPVEAFCQRRELLHTYRTPFTLRVRPALAHLPFNDGATATASAMGGFSTIGGASGAATPGRTEPTAAATVIAA